MLLVNVDAGRGKVGAEAEEYPVLGNWWKMVLAWEIGLGEIGMTWRGYPPVFCARVRILLKMQRIGVIRKLKECTSV